MFDISTTKKKKLKESDKSMTICNNWRAYKLVCLATKDVYYIGKPPKFWTELIKLKAIKHQKVKISHDVREEETSILLTVQAFFSCKRLPVNNNGTLKVWGIRNRWLRFTFQIPFAATTY